MRLSAIAFLVVTACPAWSQFAATGTTNVSVTVAAEAAIRIDTSTTTLTQGAVFANFTGTTNFTYKVRTTTTTGAATIQLQVTSDFAPGGGPSVATPPSVGDALTYTCTVSAPRHGVQRFANFEYGFRNRRGNFRCGGDLRCLGEFRLGSLDPDQ